MKGLLRFLFSGWCQQRADGLVSDGVVAAESGKLAHAMELYQQALSWAPQHVLARSNMGLSLMDEYNSNFEAWDRHRRSAHLNLTLDNLEEAIELGANRVAVWRATGHVRWRLSQFRGAAEAFEQTLSLLEDLEGDTHDAVSELEGHLSELQPLVERGSVAEDPRWIDEGPHPTSLHQALSTLEELQPAELEEVLFLWMRAFKLQLENVQEAVALFEQALELGGPHLDAHRELAQLFMAADSPESALEHSVAAYKLQPRNAGLVCNVGVCHLSLGDLKNAKEFIDLAHGMAPENGIIHKAQEALAAAFATQENTPEPLDN